MDTLKKALDYLDTEYKDFRDFIYRQTYVPSISSRDSECELIETLRKSVLYRGMGVVLFVQSLGVNYDNIKKPYEEFKEAINQLAKYGKEGIK